MEEIIPGESATEINLQLRNAPRKPWLAVISGILFPGLGQVYNGQPGKGFIFYAITVLIPFIFSHTIGLGQFAFLLILLIIDISFRIYILIDAGRQAKRLKEYQLKKYNKWFYYLLYILFIVVFSIPVDFSSLTGYRTFIIPSSGNVPTMYIGDCVVADMNAYADKQPEYGDLIVFMFNGEYRTYRVTGLPGDKINVDSGFLFINGKKCQANFRKVFQDEEIAYPNHIAGEEWQEKMPNGHSYLIHRFSTPFPGRIPDSTGFIVPAGNYFVLGDNRENALDSRYIGPIRIEDISGKILYSYWGKTPDRINIDLRK